MPTTPLRVRVRFELDEAIHKLKDRDFETAQDEAILQEATDRILALLDPVPRSDVEDWWANTAFNDAERTLPKISEYGAHDLEVMGTTLLLQMGMEDQPIRVGVEMACQFYLLGKVARGVAAYRAGRVPSDDTLFDQTIYSMMTRRIREVGQWP